MDTSRNELIGWVQGALDEVTPGQFLLVEYLTDEGLPVEPYAQAALEPGGWSCEVVSARYLPGGRWPIDEPALARTGWSGPDERTDNWWRCDVEFGRAAALLVDALWSGRGCTDPDRFAVSTGTFPSPPDAVEPRCVCWRMSDSSSRRNREDRWTSSSPAPSCSPSCR